MNTPPREVNGTAVRSVEWTTFALIVACYGLWAAVLFWMPFGSVVLATLVLGLLIALHASLTHEVLHGHPFPKQSLNNALMFLPLNLAIPYHRFRDLHLAHHRDSNLTDPYDDPETNYLDPEVWNNMAQWKRWLFQFNNTLLGRVTIGAAIGQMVFYRDEWRGALRGDCDILRAWALHVPGMAVVIALVLVSPMPVLAYLVAAYFALSILKIRTFLEHQAHEKVRGRTVIIEDRGPLAFMFLNNNLHVVHHMNPNAPWYVLPALYRKGRERYLACNEGYVYKSYGEVFRRYFLSAKDPVPHPLWRRD